MPTYDYTCDACGHEFEREQRITEQPVKKCPACGKLKARRMIGGGGFILKGGGWESDLYSGPSNRSESASKKATSSEATSSAEKTSSPTKADKDNSPKPPKSTSSKSDA
ncbi:MAG: zinc ribbon domain-containing protein [Myxococcales bacterium]|nr:zinc ribbon domain-containing protein [Myxococcales bacterium]